MTGIVVLILRLLLAAALYAFLGWALYTLWHDLRLQSQIIASRKIPTLTLLSQHEHAEPVMKFNSPEVLIGRDTACEYPLADETISARHARLSYHHNQWWLEDLNSTNGTFLNDERVITPTVIMSGDELRCGEISFELIIESNP